MVLHISRERIDELIEEAMESLGDRSADSRIDIQIPEEPLFLDCDRRLVGMLLRQYLDNACKYAEFDSTITIGAQRSGDELVLSVHSFGPVIPMADRERIFDRYFRSPAASSHAAGTGIGLSIAKRVALAHGGSVWVSSDEAEGNTFFASLLASARATHSLFSNHESSSVDDRRDDSDSRSRANKIGTPDLHHPSNEDPSLGTPDLHHPSNEDLLLGTPDLERSIS